MSEAATLIVGADGPGGVIRVPGLQLSMSSWCLYLKQCGREKMASSLLSQPRTIVLHKP